MSGCDFRVAMSACRVLAYSGNDRGCLEQPTTCKSLARVFQKGLCSSCRLLFQQITLLHTFYGPFSRTTQVSRYQKGKTDLDFTEARDNELRWHQPGHMQVCTSLQTDNHASTRPLRFLQDALPAAQLAASKH